MTERFCEPDAAMRARRSLLYVPGSNRRALDKTASLDADAFIFDLEDAVAPEAKSAARRNVVELLTATQSSRRRIVRINSLQSSCGRDDLDAVCRTAPDAILVPKISDAASVIEANDLLGRAGAPAQTRLWIMIETPSALLELGAIARAAREPGARLAAFVMGVNDLAKETGVRQTPDRAPMAAWLSGAVVAARACRLEIFDGVFADVTDLAGFRRECAQGRDFGMDGKTLIHPDQIGPCNEVFAPSAQDIAAAREIVAAFAAPEAAGRGALLVGGRMVEKLHVEMARRVLAMAQDLEERRG